MPHTTFVRFIWPSFLAMILFIALPVVSVAIQSLFVEHEQVMKEVENCGPFKCDHCPVQVDTEATSALRTKPRPSAGSTDLGTYTNRAHLAFDEVGEIWGNERNLGGLHLRGVYNLPLLQGAVLHAEPIPSW